LVRARFDRQYYERFYGDARDRSVYRADERKLGAFVAGYLKYLDQPVRNVVDIGCGFGQWKAIIASHFPKARYTGVEVSAWLCGEYGWTESTAMDFESPTPFDLVICKDTLQYLSPKEFRLAAGNLSQLCSGVLYASILTTEDWKANCDRTRTDPRVYLRTGNWYRRILGRYFTNLGGGLFLSPRSPAVPWELDALPVIMRAGQDKQ
jgi:SAM-dependent methyltransferase